MFQTVSDKLKAILDALKGTSKPFVAVYDYHTLETTGFPYASFEPIEFRAEILDTCNNLRTYVFQILIFQEVTETGGRKEAKEIVTKAMDDVVLALDADYTLTGTAKLVRPIGGRIEPFVTASGKCLVGTVLVEVETVASVL
jgi:hypothetical protein